LIGAGAGAGASANESALVGSGVTAFDRGRVEPVGWSQAGAIRDKPPKIIA